MNGIEKKIRENNLKHSHVIEITAYDENAKYLIGWPGYRTSNNKSGLGYLETQAELAHMQGLFIKWLATGQFRTHNPIYLLEMSLLGILCGGVPLLFMISEIVMSRRWDILIVFVIGFPYIACGILLLVNVILSIIYWNGKTITGD